MKIHDKNEIKKYLIGAEFDGSRIIEKSKNKTPFRFEIKLINELVKNMKKDKLYNKNEIIKILQKIYKEMYPNSDILSKSVERYVGALQRIIFLNSNIFHIDIFSVEENIYDMYDPKNPPINDNIIWRKHEDFIIVDKGQKDLSNLPQKEIRKNVLELDSAREQIKFLRYSLNKIKKEIEDILER